MLRRPRIPLNVGLYSSILPCDVISVWPKPGQDLDEVWVVEGTLDDRLRSFQGGGGPPTSLRSGQAINVFVVDRGASISGFGNPERSALLRVGPHSHGMVYIGWSHSGDRSESSSLCIVWPAGTRASGAPPRLLVANEAEEFYRYARDRTGESPFTTSMLKLGRRLPRMTRRHIRARVKQERTSEALRLREAESVRISNIKVEGFRGFRDASELRLAQPNGEPGSGLTVVVGANNTGKSTLWESFDAIARKQKHDVSFNEGQRNRQSAHGVQIAVRCADGALYTLSSQNAQTSETRGDWEAPHGPRELRIVTVPSRRQFQAHFSKNVNADPTWMFGSQEFTRQRQIDNGFTGRLFDLHGDAAKKSQFDALMTKVLGRRLAWTIELGEGPHGQNFYLKVQTGDQVNHSSEGLGDGIVSLLYILNALYDSTEESILVFDEPELSLHPQMIRNLNGLLAEYAASRQIVIFTHSPILVSWDNIAAGAEIARVHKVGPDSRIAQVPRKTIDELSKARGGWTNPHVLGADATEALFLEDKIVVVEGQEDTALLPTVFREAGVDQRGTVFGWGSGGGNGNPRRIVALLQGLGFKKVVALLDADKADEAEAIQMEYPDYYATTIPADDIRDKPAVNKSGKSGLLDAKGKHLKPSLAAATRARLERVNDYLSME